VTPQADFRLSALERSSAVNVDRAVFAMAGTMVLASLVLAWLLSPYWLLLAAFVGANMLQAAFTGFCPAAMIFNKLGLKPGPAFACAAKAERAHLTARL
jgi:hypothetical protein